MMRKRLFGLFLLTGFATGCARISSAPHVEPQKAHVIESQLADAARSVSESLYQLAQVELAQTPKSELPQPQSAEYLGMTDLASIDWTGPVEPLVLKIAKASQYELKIIGAKPSIPAVVAIKKQDATLAEILRDAHYQAQKKVDIQVYPESKIIELRYLGF